MTIYSGQTTQMLQGVSQQHPKDRAEGQNGEQVNCVSDIVQGLRRRPAIQTLSAMAGISTGFTLDADSAIYSYSRGDGSEEYIILTDTDGNVKVYDAFTGSEETVNFLGTAPEIAATQAYLASTSPKDNLRFHTIGDTTFVLATDETIDMDTTEESDSVWTASCEVRAASYGHTYSIKIDTVTVASVTLPSTVTISTTSANKTLGLSTTTLAKWLATAGTPPTGWTQTAALSANLPAGFSYAIAKDVILIKKDDETSYDIYIDDGNNSQDFRLVKKAVTVVDDLPKISATSYHVEVTGTGDSVYNDFWVKWVPEQTGIWYGPGKWQECAAPGSLIDLDADTMPHKIVRNSSGEFDISAETWQPREAGDDDTNPQPSFVGYKALDIGSYSNRLYMLTGENICMTTTFDYSGWWAASTASPADDDPVDSASSDNQITDLLHSAVYNGSLVLFSQNAQFIHPKDEVVKPSTFAVAADSKFNVSPVVRPVTTGSYIVFPTVFGNYSQVWEYNINTLTGKPECEQNTKHVPKYIEGSPTQMVGNTVTDFVFMRTDDDDTNIYVHQFYIKEQKRAQLAWHKWTVPNVDTIHTMTLLGNKLYLIAERDSVIYLEYIDVSLPMTENSDFELYLDHYRTNEVDSGAWTVDGKDYTARVPVAEAAITDLIQGTGGTNPGMVWKHVVDSGYAYGNAPAFSFIIQGYPYLSNGIITNPYVKDQKGRPYTKRTIIDEVVFNVQDTGYLTLEVGHAAGADYTLDFNGIILNHWQYKIGQASELDTDIYLPVRDYRELVTLSFESDHHLGFALMSMEWVVRMTTRGRRST